MHTLFEALIEHKPGPVWHEQFVRHWPGYKAWYLKRGLAERASLAQCTRSLSEYMPEFVPIYQQLCELVGQGEIAHRFLSLYRPPAYVAACSQMVSADASFLIRNYDYAPALLDGLILNTQWSDKRVLGVSDCLVGLLDGINSDGLCVSLAFGGSRVVRRGFGIPLIVRYVLETCENVPQAEQALLRLPSHMAYNITVLDRSGARTTVLMRPGGGNQILPGVGIATNHQTVVSEWPAYSAATHSYERANHLHALSVSPPLNMLREFHTPPLLSRAYKKGQGTLYTAIYDPINLGLSLHWPEGEPMYLSLYPTAYAPLTRRVNYEQA